MNEDVSKYIKKQKSPQKEICRKLKEIILTTFPNIKEEMKMGVPWYEGKYYIVGLKDHVNLGFLVQGLSEKEMNSFEGKGKFMRHLKFFSLEEINEKKIVKLLRLVKKKKKSISSCFI